MNYYFKRCGHSNDELNLVCIECGRFFIRWPIIPFVLTIVSIVVIYFFSNNFFLSSLYLYSIVSIVFLISILRRKPVQLAYMLCIVPSTFYVSYFMQRRIESNYSSEAELVLFAVTFALVIIAALISIYLGIMDAKKNELLNKGSLWVLISILASLSFTLLYYLILFFYNNANNVSEPSSKQLKDFYFYLNLVYKIRFIIVFAIFIITVIISTAIAFRKELKTNVFKDPFRKSFHIIVQFVAILLNEIYRTFVNTITRILLILNRLLKFFIIFGSSYLLLVLIIELSQINQLLSKNRSFIPVSITTFGELALVIFGIGATILLLTLATYNESEHSEFSFKSIIKRVLYMEKVRFNNLNISVLVYFFFFSLAYLFSWLIISAIHYAVSIEGPNPIGLITISYSVIWIVAGTIYALRNRNKTMRST